MVFNVRLVELSGYGIEYWASTWMIEDVLCIMVLVRLAKSLADSALG